MVPMTAGEVFPAPATGGYDRRAELKAFDETKSGVKGLVDAGVTEIPRIFLHPPDDTPVHRPEDGAAAEFSFPLIDLGGADERETVDRVREAAETWGFFQVANHGIQTAVMEETLAGVRRFFEQEDEVKRGMYTRDKSNGIVYNSNFDLHSSPAANWRDTFFCPVAPLPPRPEDLPAVCKDVMIEYSEKLMEVGKRVLGLLSAALGLRRGHLEEMGCAEGLSVLGHYYPPCPQPERTMGTTRHADNSFITLLLQDQMGGLQVLHRRRWVDVPPVPAALIVNFGDILQLVTNDRFKSVEHRVVASRRGPRISVAGFFTNEEPVSAATKLFGPIEELLSEGNPARYRKTSTQEYSDYFRNKGLDGTSALLHFRI